MTTTFMRSLALFAAIFLPTLAAPARAQDDDSARVIDIVDRTGTAAMAMATAITLNQPPHKPERRDRVSPAHIQS